MGCFFVAVLYSDILRGLADTSCPSSNDNTNVDKLLQGVTNNRFTDTPSSFRMYGHFFNVASQREILETLRSERS